MTKISKVICRIAGYALIAINFFRAFNISHDFNRLINQVSILFGFIFLISFFMSRKDKDFGKDAPVDLDSGDDRHDHE